MGRSLVHELGQLVELDAQRAIETAESARSTHLRLTEVVEEMRDLNDQVVEIHASSKSTAAMLEVLRRLAGEAQMLAINASIAASRAAEWGAEFGVIADEVRSLAKQSSELVNRADVLIEANVRGTLAGEAASKSLVAGIEGCLHALANDARLAEDAADRLGQHRDGLSRVRTLTTAVNIAGRQRMLSQRMAKTVLLICLGHDAVAQRDMLAADIELFERSLSALRCGDASLGLAATEDATVIQRITEGETVWKTYKSMLEVALPLGEDEAEPAFDVAELQSGSLTLLASMQALVQAIEAQA